MKKTLSKQEKNKLKSFTSGLDPTYWWLYKAAKFNLKLAKTQQEGNNYICMAVVIFTAFMIEALLNHIIDIQLTTLNDEEKNKLKFSAPKDKLKEILQKINFPFDSQSPSYLAFCEIFDYRKELAHGNTIVKTAGTLENVHIDEQREICTVVGDWHSKTTSQNAEKLFNLAKELMEKISKHAGINFPFALGGESTSQWSVD